MLWYEDQVSMVFRQLNAATAEVVVVVVVVV